MKIVARTERNPANFGPRSKAFSLMLGCRTKKIGNSESKFYSEIKFRFRGYFQLQYCNTTQKHHFIDHITRLFNIGLARIFDWGEPKPQITSSDLIKNFERGIFCWGKHIVERKIRSRGLVLARNYELVQGRGLKPIVNM